MNEGQIYVHHRYPAEVSARPALKARTPTVEVITDATAMSQAGSGPEYIQ